MEQYKKEKIFENSLAEFDDARFTTSSRTSVGANRFAGQPLKNSSRNIKRARALTISHMSVHKHFMPRAANETNITGEHGK